MKDRARDVATGLAAIAALAAIMVVLPVVLYHYGGSPLPRHLASWHRFGAILSNRDDGSMLVAVVRDCSWLAWLLFSISALAEAGAALRGDHGPRLRLGGMRIVSARLVTLAALAFAASPTLTQTASAVVASPQHGVPSPAMERAPAVTESLADPTLRGLSVGTATAPSARPLTTVRVGDCLWSIAQHYLGSGDRYPEIARLNYGHEMGDGQLFDLRCRSTCSLAHLEHATRRD
jgi:hypothetical protein